MKLILFDIDGTLIDSGGAGNRAFSMALKSAYGLEGGLNGVRLDGKTDLQILREVLDRYGTVLESREELIQTLFDRYLAFLRRELERVGERYRVLPGVTDLLSLLEQDASFLLGIASGNIESGARLKLERGGLNRFFRLGGFGSDSESRTELIKTAMKRGEDHAHPSVIESTIVIGDTPRDILHGKEAGAEVVAVASGYYSLAQLKEHDPDLCVESLVPMDQIVEFLSR